MAGSLSRRCRAAPSDWAFHQALSVGFSRQPGSSRAPPRVWYPKLHYKQANFHKVELFPFLPAPQNPFSINSVLEFKSKLGQNSFLTEELLPWFGFAGCELSCLFHSTSSACAQRVTSTSSLCLLSWAH